MPKKHLEKTRGKVFFWGLGRRKTSVARVRLYPDLDEVVVNGKDVADYIDAPNWVDEAIEPLRITEMEGKFGAVVRASGGGKASQARAIRHGLARALVRYDEKLRLPLKRAGMLTRDSRMVERKKPGLKGARKRPQFSKR